MTKKFALIILASLMALSSTTIAQANTVKTTQCGTNVACFTAALEKCQPAAVMTSSTAAQGGSGIILSSTIYHEILGTKNTSCSYRFTVKKLDIQFDPQSMREKYDDQTSEWLTDWESAVRQDSNYENLEATCTIPQGQMSTSFEVTQDLGLNAFDGGTVFPMCTGTLVDYYKQMTEAANNGTDAVSHVDAQAQHNTEPAYNSVTKGYTVKSGKTYWSDGYESHEIYGADTTTFQIVHLAQSKNYPYQDWAKDRNHVYFRESPIIGADPTTFTLIDETFAKDKNHVYFTSDYETPSVKILPDADPKTFKIVYEASPIFDIYYSKDGRHAFRNANIIPNSDARSFTVIDNNWSKDNKHVYYETTALPGADPRSFNKINDYFEKDAHHIYLREKLIKDADIKSFQILNTNYSKDKKHVFFWGNEIPGADAASFQILGNEYAKDRNQVYATTISGGVTSVVGADPNTFNDVSSKYGEFGRDKNNIYFDDTVFPVVNPASFEITGCGTGKDKTRTYTVPSISISCATDL